MKTQSGNALWLILIAIFLLGGLTVLLSRAGNQTEDTGSGEKTQIVASEVLRYGADIETAIKTLLGRGCSENEISLWHDSNGDNLENSADANYNSDAPTDHSCHVFHVDGAGLTFKDAAKKINATLQTQFYTASSAAAYKHIGTDERADVFLYITGTPAQMNAFCAAANRIGGIAPTGSAPANVFDPADTGVVNVVATPFTGTFAADDTSPDENPAGGKKSFCAGISTTRTVYIYAVLAR